MFKLQEKVGRLTRHDDLETFVFLSEKIRHGDDNIVEFEIGRAAG